MKVTISRAAEAEILYHAASSPNVEICGLLFGESNHIERAEGTANVAADPAIRFEIDPAALFVAIREERAGGEQLLGYFHSHPQGSAVPSAEDARMALDRDRLWLVVARGEMRLWRTVEPGDLRPVELVLASQSPDIRELCASPSTGNQTDIDGKSFEFASLLASRLCHDLLSPIGALNNGIELLTDEHDPEMRERCMKLLAESAQISATKLKFFRLAFGATDVAIEGLVSAQSRVKLEWMVEELSMPKARLKIMLNLVLLAADALVRGGVLLVGAEGGEIVVRAEGERVVFDQELRAAILGKTDAEKLTPRVVAAWLVHLLVEDGGGEMQVSGPEENVLLFGAAFGS